MRSAPPLRIPSGFSAPAALCPCISRLCFTPPGSRSCHTILKHRHRTVRIDPGRPHQANPFGDHLPVIPPEVVRVEEGKHPPAGLVTDTVSCSEAEAFASGARIVSRSASFLA